MHHQNAHIDSVAFRTFHMTLRCTAIWNHQLPMVALYQVQVQFLGVSIVMGLPPIAGWFIRDNPHDVGVALFQETTLKVDSNSNSNSRSTLESPISSCSVNLERSAKRPEVPHCPAEGSWGPWLPCDGSYVNIICIYIYTYTYIHTL